MASHSASLSLVPCHGNAWAGLQTDVTGLLEDWHGGDPAALDRLAPIVYDELLRLARMKLAGEFSNHTLQPTALVHEAYLKLVDHTRISWRNRSHFFAIAATIMRRILIDNARKRNAGKRGAGLQISVSEEMRVSDQEPGDVLSLDLALQHLAKIDERKSRVVELKYFGGLCSHEISEVVGISTATVGRELRVAHAWLRREMAGH